MTEESSGSISQKSPQELLSQVASVYSPGFDLSDVQGGELLDEEYKQERERLEEEAGDLTDDELSHQLEALFEEGYAKGMYSPVKGQFADTNIAEKQRYYEEAWGVSPGEAHEEAVRYLSRLGFLANLRTWRRDHENEVRSQFDKFVSSVKLSPEEEQKRIEALQKLVVDIRQGEEKSLSEHFPGGNFLFHGTGVSQAVDIVSGGELVSAKTLYDREQERRAREGGEQRFFKRNSGYEGISWSLNEIDALPGDRYHLVGFLASPQEALSSDLQLVIPSRPAPNELISINRDVDAKAFYEAKTQDELLFTFSLGESNSVWGNISQLEMYLKFKGEGKDIVETPLLYDFTNNMDEHTTELLRSKYSIREDGTIELSPELLQQISKDIPVAAVWFQALIDTGRIKNITGYESAKSVKQIVEQIGEDNYKNFLPELKKEREHVQEAIKKEEEKIDKVSVSIEQMYIVVPRKDLQRWLKVLVRCEKTLRGIIVYDDKEVRLEDFASTHRGDADKLSRQIRRAIPMSDGYIDYESQLLGEVMTEEKLVGHRKHVIGEQYLSKRKSLVKGGQGNVVVTS